MNLLDIFCQSTIVRKPLIPESWLLKNITVAWHRYAYGFVLIPHTSVLVLAVKRNKAPESLSCLFDWSTILLIWWFLEDPGTHKCCVSSFSWYKMDTGVAQQGNTSSSASPYGLCIQTLESVGAISIQTTTYIFYLYFQKGSMVLV